MKHLPVGLWGAEPTLKKIIDWIGLPWDFSAIILLCTISLLPLFLLGASTIREYRQIQSGEESGYIADIRSGILADRIEMSSNSAGTQIKCFDIEAKDAEDIDRVRTAFSLNKEITISFTYKATQECGLIDAVFLQE
jgi:hypothetical protein